LGRARGSGLEGLIGKRSGSRYEAGKRSGAWVKIKLHQEQEFVIGGYAEPEGARKHFGALLVGFYEDKELKFAGRVGTGFSEKLLSTLFSELIKLNPKPSRKGNGFQQPLDPHEHWHVDISYLNIVGTFFYLCSGLDGCSRFLVHWELRTLMTEL
jgi:ATP-dependent DNA ligase